MAKHRGQPIDEGAVADEIYKKGWQEGFTACIDMFNNNTNDFHYHRGFIAGTTWLEETLGATINDSIERLKTA